MTNIVVILLYYSLMYFSFRLQLQAYVTALVTSRERDIDYVTAWRCWV